MRYTQLVGDPREENHRRLAPMPLKSRPGPLGDTWGLVLAKGWDMPLPCVDPLYGKVHTDEWV